MTENMKDFKVEARLHKELTRPKFVGGKFVLFLHTALVNCYLKERTQTVDKRRQKKFGKEKQNL